MTREEKQLLLIDLCARLPYKTYIEIIDKDGNIYDEVELDFQHTNTVRHDESTSIRPYLRPMSSMTTEEEYEYHQCKNIDYLGICEMEHIEMLETAALWFSRATDWLNKNGFDYRGLISMGLALPAIEGMYK